MLPINPVISKQICRVHKRLYVDVGDKIVLTVMSQKTGLRKMSVKQIVQDVSFVPLRGTL